jgi:hypothetical protein
MTDILITLLSGDVGRFERTTVKARGKPRR